VLAAGIGVGSRKGSRRRNLRPTDGACYLPSLPVLQHRDSKGKTSLWPSGALFLSSVFCAFLGKRERGSARAGAAGPGGLGEREDQRQSGGPRFEHAGGDHRDGCAHRGCPVSEGAGIGSVRSMTLLRRREERQDAGGEKRRPHGASDGAGQSKRLVAGSLREPLAWRTGERRGRVRRGRKEWPRREGGGEDSRPKGDGLSVGKPTGR